MRSKRRTRRSRVQKRTPRGRLRSTKSRVTRKRTRSHRYKSKKRRNTKGYQRGGMRTYPKGREYKDLRTKIEQAIESSTASNQDVVFLINSIYKGMIDPEGEEYRHLRNRIKQAIESSTVSNQDVVFLINSIYDGMITDGLIGGRDVSGSTPKKKR